MCHTLCGHFAKYNNNSYNGVTDKKYIDFRLFVIFQRWPHVKALSTAFATMTTLSMVGIIFIGATQYRQQSVITIGLLCPDEKTNYIAVIGRISIRREKKNQS